MARRSCVRVLVGVSLMLIQGCADEGDEASPSNESTVASSGHDATDINAAAEGCAIAEAWVVADEAERASLRLAVEESAPDHGNAGPTASFVWSLLTAVTDVGSTEDERSMELLAFCRTGGSSSDPVESQTATTPPEP